MRLGMRRHVSIMINNGSRKEKDIRSQDCSKVHSLSIHETVRIIVEEVFRKKRIFICIETSECLSLPFGKFVHIIVDARSRKRKYLFGETEVNFIYLRSLRIFGSLPMVDLEKEKLHLERERSEIHSPLFDESVPIIVDDGSRERRHSFGDREQGIQLAFDRREYSDQRGES